ncbi:glycoside hydrolase family 55 protein [Streptomyces profundus]|uniref:glycoside hydrolase family 55 protein n=1 Tax=Streptomyces profundus TaxID=2867410 RepID=UPI001D16A0FD|nr:glycoside hydrolase family 55 protein [Streptomyces sp. MA3_2.13]UED86142.1 glycoside hydrolase family 55 protein [Streptomyces sp. MA3_2.13]
MHASGSGSVGPTVGRRSLLGGAIGVAVAAVGTTRLANAAGPAPRGSARGASAAELWAEYAAAPYAHPQIPYVGRAGAFGGTTDLPEPEVVASALDFGADPDGVADSAPAINAAIGAAADAGGGAVLLPAGRYRIDDILHIGADGVVLRGEGSGRTVIEATRSLTDLIGRYGSRYGGDKSSWSWSGGLIWLCPTARWRSLTDAIRAENWPFEGWTGNARDEWESLTEITGSPSLGDWTIEVADTDGLAEGDRVLLRLSDDAEHTLLTHMAGEVPGTASYDWASRTKLTSYVPYEWPCRLTAVDHGAGRVTLDRPLPLDARPEWDPRLTTLVPPLVGAGVEGLTLVCPELPLSEHLLDTGFNGVALQCAWDCWVRDVEVTHADNGFLLVSAKGCTLRGTTISGRGSHHPYCCREGSHDNLVEDFALLDRTSPPPADTQLHGINVEGLSSYNVWSRGRMEMGTFDSHRGMPFANVRTEITVNNNGTHGGDDTAGPLYGARFTHWNVTVTNGRAGMIKLDEIAPYSATVAISEVTEFGQIDQPDFVGELHTRLESYGDPSAADPANLHAAQRDL